MSPVRRQPSAGVSTGMWYLKRQPCGTAYVRLPCTAVAPGTIVPLRTTTVMFVISISGAHTVVGAWAKAEIGIPITKAAAPAARMRRTPLVIVLLLYFDLWCVLKDAFF